MHEAKLTWRERTSESAFVASIWACKAPQAITRTVLADPCISIVLIKDGGGNRVALRGPATKPRTELLTAGYTCTAIRLQPGVLLRDFPAQKFINSSLTIPADAASRFLFKGNHFQFPDFDNAEILIERLYDLGCLCHEDPEGTQNAQVTEVISLRSYSRLVKRTTGLSPYQLHQLQRIHQALRLLKQGVPAATVATDLNFVDQSHLIHASRQFLGHTPKQVRRLPQAP